MLHYHRFMIILTTDRNPLQAMALIPTIYILTWRRKIISKVQEVEPFSRFCGTYNNYQAIEFRNRFVM